MRYEYNIWNITESWMPLRATTLEGAQQELDQMGPYAEEAIIRDESGNTYKRRQPKQDLHFF